MNSIYQKTRSLANPQYQVMIVLVMKVQNALVPYHKPHPSKTSLIGPVRFLGGVLWCSLLLLDSTVPLFLL